MNTSSDLRLNRNSKRLVAALTLTAAALALFPGAASAHTSIQNGVLGTVSPAVYRAYGLEGPVTASPASAAVVSQPYGLEGPVTVSPASVN